MWIKRVEWAELLAAKAQTDFLRERLRLAEDRQRADATLIASQIVRIKELEAAVLRQNDELVQARHEKVSRPVPLVLDESLFDEDPKLVERDREMIKTHGTSDGLLAEYGDE